MILTMTGRRRWGMIATLILLLPRLMGCGPSTNQTLVDQGAAPAVVRAASTVGMVNDLVHHVGGDAVKATAMMGSGVDPHLYKATRDDVRIIMEADIVFYSGLMLEGKMIDTLRQVSRIRPVHAVTAEIDPQLLLEPDDFSGHYDPHVWMDVAAWSAGVDVIRDALVKLDPDNREAYVERAASYRAKLQQLDQLARESIATIPAARRVLITSHDAFNYFGRAYGLEVLGVQGLSTESEAGLQQINQLVDMLVEREITAVFIETSVPRKSIEALIDGAAARGHQVTIGGTLYSDAMGEPGTFEGTYVGMITHNVQTVVRALGGTIDEHAWNAVINQTGTENEAGSQNVTPAEVN